MEAEKKVNEEESAKVVLGLAGRYNKDVAWQLRAVDALASASSAQRALVQLARKQWPKSGLELVEELMCRGAAAGPGPGSAGPGAYVHGAGRGLRRPSGAAAPAGTAGDDAAGLEELLFPSRVLQVTFTLHNAGAHLAVALASHASANNIRGTVRHVSARRSDFVLVVSEQGGYQTLRSYLTWVQQQRVLLLRAEEDVPSDRCAVITSDLRSLRSSEPHLVALLRRGRLQVSVDSLESEAFEAELGIGEEMEREWASDEVCD